ncbi:hypothetical protein FFK22_040690 [Mycobacterium sp. KBS0706]|uniref:hypothetical protein n=1 Tax=Mycobacterium sp. KBS0706 TaxID=2578109 RepID=UPI00110FDD3D|nr:hypothetical protein [Mycobacterium sp. KBS0706]TSD82894.1 hypothetical protein FFK22_040690 [Mycobacterium sp. KBS0706]
MKTPLESLQSTLDDFASYIEDTFGGYAPAVCDAWHVVLRSVDVHAQRVEVAPGFFARWVEFDHCDGERDADDQRSVVRLEFVSQIIGDVVMHLSTEDTDAVPRLYILTTMRRGVGLLDKEWDELEPAEAIKRFMDRHNTRAAAEMEHR